MPKNCNNLFYHLIEFSYYKFNDFNFKFDILHFKFNKQLEFIVTNFIVYYDDGFNDVILSYS